MDKITEKFKVFHDNNPHVYEELVSLARQVKDTGKSKYGIKALFEVVRFHYDIKTTGDYFKLNNNYTALYARMIMEKEQDLKDFFSLRTRTSS